MPNKAVVCQCHKPTDILEALELYRRGLADFVAVEL